MQKTSNFTLLKKYKLDVNQIEFLSNSNLEFDLTLKSIIVEKLLESKEVAFTNLKKGNITRRAFGANAYIVSQNYNFWTLGTNFNNTRNDISSMCAERSAVIGAYNRCLNKNIKDFKIRYIAMAQALELEDINESIFPCEDCLSWFNTERYFDNNTIIFTFEKNNNKLCVKAVKLDELLPYRQILTSNVLSKNIEYTVLAKNSKVDIENIVQKVKQAYDNNTLARTSNQNVAATILTDKKVYTASKIDWTRRWFVEPLELAVSKALDEEKNINIKAIAYFGDEVAKTDQGEFTDGVVSIKTLGRIRQKFANSDTLLILNFENNILVMKLSEYLPKKFVQGYEIK